MLISAASPEIRNREHKKRLSDSRSETLEAKLFFIVAFVTNILVNKPRTEVHPGMVVRQANFSLCQSLVLILRSGVLVIFRVYSIYIADAAW